ncbi:glycoside hydrolase family 3 N-terminal domain-containing protein [Cellulomonas sp. ATA003]|uniref:glycoside hydrolase family 3 protein n=1 Tax=Cellulomonas sp. ATA003 TaxID=3073064 RepID=UPI0028736CC8|nr:glycoside hydrolase family 3 N-terminal domain-containing protein [Cellulomonas sp. ATA003]WNB87231.1 glycoside hydrolase family 3 N-terminal domain-containing protein [Cellulomonas sp. ATA003]
MTVPHPTQPALGARTSPILRIDGLEFKDLNGNGRLDPYEDWRLPVAERVADLLPRMSVEEKVGLLLITSHYMGTSKIIGDAEQGILNTHEKWSDTNFWAAETSSTRHFDPPVLDYTGSHRAIAELGLRYLIVRDNPTSFDLATWTNALQELAESTPLGIPAVLVSNPRNHVSSYKLFGIAEAADQMSQWPGELGLAATQDADLVEEFGRLAARQWRAAGITKGYMYMADIVTEPRWSRANGTFGENPELAAAMIAAVTRGFQGETLGRHSVSLTTKHFPGGGPRDRGHDPHFEHGRFQPYPTEGSLHRYHLPVFQAAIDAGTTSVMPYYAMTTNAMSAQQLRGGRAFEEVGFAYDKHLITDVLRGEMGFTGYVNSDTGISTGMPWGVESLSRPERFGKAIDAGVNAFAGDGNPQPLLDAVAQGLVSHEQLDRNAAYLLAEMFSLGLFENPYVDPDAAQAIAEDREIQRLADSAHRRSLVLLRNDRGVLPLAAESTVPAGQADQVGQAAQVGQAEQVGQAAAAVRLYVEVFAGEDSAQTSEQVTREVVEALGDGSGIAVVSSPDDATHALLWLRPMISLLNDRPDTELSLAVDGETGVDVDRVLELENQLPTVLAVDFANPWLLDRVAPGAAAVVATFSVLTDALVDLVRGAATPSGRLPFTLPADEAAVDGKHSDIPGADESYGYAYTDATGADYVFGYGRSGF